MGGLALSEAAICHVVNNQLGNLEAVTRSEGGIGVGHGGLPGDERVETVMGLHPVVQPHRFGMSVAVRVLAVRR